MKIGKKTVNVLKNFATINPSIVLQEGSTITTMSVAGNIYARYNGEEKFPVDVHLYDLNEFLSAISIFEDSDQKFNKNSVTISSGKKNLRYNYSEERMVSKAPPLSEERLEGSVGSFKLERSELSDLLRAIGLCKANEVSISTKDNKVTLKAYNKSMSSDEGGSYDFTVDSELNIEYEGKIPADTLLCIPGDYTVSLYDSFLHFKGDNEVEYIIATE